ncbi:MAG TPA: GTPase [Kineosporiaceae bacterium]|nr:GTPase [Kineosporiaceae bacterium]
MAEQVPEAAVAAGTGADAVAVEGSGGPAEPGKAAPVLSRRARRGPRPNPVPDVLARMNVLAQALEAGGERLEPAAVARATSALERAGQRMQFGADLTVVALVGATGSGKSSMFNALAEMEIAEVTPRRPTTSRPTACVWGGSDATSLLDWLGVSARDRTRRESVLDADSQARLHGLVLLDLPDHDSAFVHHRLEMDRLIELVDLLVWVVDPQKYADEALHSGYLRPFSGRSDVMLVVLNQIDRLGPEEAATCERDLRRLLDADGLKSVRLLTTSATRGDGVPALRAVLESTARQRETALGRTFADLAAAAGQLAAWLAETEPDLQELGAADRLVRDLADAAGVPVVLDTVDADQRRRAGALLDWPYLRWWQRLRPDPLEQTELGVAGARLRDLVGAALPAPTPSQQAQVDLATRTLADAVCRTLPPRWASAVRAASGWHRGGSGLSAALDQAIREVDLTWVRPRWWTVAWLVQVLLAGCAGVGFGWLAVIGVLDWLSGVPGRTPFLGPVPLPTALLLAGLLGGALAWPAHRLMESGIRRRRAELAARLEAAVEQVAQTWVLDGVAGVLADHREVRDCLAELR